MSEIHALSGAYAVDALETFERLQFERHLAECPVCQAEVDSLREATSLLGETTPVDPPAALRARVLADIGHVRPLPPLTSPVVSESSERRPGRRLRTLVAAAAAIVAVGAGTAVITQQLTDDSSSSPNLSAADRIVGAPDARTYKKTFSDGSTATVYVSKELNGAVLRTHAMADAPSGHAYALWMQHDNVMVPAGSMTKGGDQDIVLSGDAKTATAFGITVEDAAQEPTTPSSDLVTYISFRQT